MKLLRIDSSARRNSVSRQLTEKFVETWQNENPEGEVIERDLAKTHLPLITDESSIAVPLSGMIALAGGLSILLGYRAKIGAWLLVLFLAVVTPMLHNFWTVADPMMHQMQFIMFMKNVSILGGALLVTQLGAGPWSLDGRRR